MTRNVSTSPQATTTGFAALGATLSNAVGGGLAPLDWVRAALYRISGRPFNVLLGDRERRTFWFTWGYLGAALLATLVWPLGLLALGPIVWGIPHILGDIRYLVVKPGYHRNRLRLFLVSAALLASLLGGGIVAGGIAVVLAIALADAPWRSRLTLLIPALLLLAFVSWHRRPSELVFAHLHNAVAAAWLIASFRSVARRLFVVLGLVSAVALLTFVPLGRLPLLPNGLDGMEWAYHLGSLTPATASEWWFRLVLVFAFAQAFHYAVWVRLVPELERRRRAPRSFRASYRALESDFGTWPLLLVVLSMLTLAVASVFALRESREAYLRFALFHGYLELAFLAAAWLETGRTHMPALREREAVT